MNMHLLVPRSRASAKVKFKYEGYISQKNGRFGGIRVSQTHLVFKFEIKITSMWSFDYVYIFILLKRNHHCKNVSFHLISYLPSFVCIFPNSQLKSLRH